MFLKFIRRIPKKWGKEQNRRDILQKRKKNQHFSLNTNASVSPSAFPSTPTNSSGRRNFCFSTTTVVHWEKVLILITGIKKNSIFSKPFFVFYFKRLFTGF